ncbi:MAG: serine deaminase [Alphaproteobacteria bacterium]|nr:MAG: serine deaminase [Alphaproteobacteria bacterium]
MALDLKAIDNCLVEAGTKGLPHEAEGAPLSEIDFNSLNPLKGDCSYPVAIIKEQALNHNIYIMQRYMDRAGMRFAPHGKTTMSPQIFDRQLEAGAWGITVATMPQVRVCRRFGIFRIIIANQVISTKDIQYLVQETAQNPDFICFSLVDSIEAADRLQSIIEETNNIVKLKVLLEIGMSGGRCGCRTMEEALSIAHHIKTLSNVELHGLESYEGLLNSGKTEQDTLAVNEFMAKMKMVYNNCVEHNLFFNKKEIMLTAGGTAFFDLVAKAFGDTDKHHIVPVIRSGCYVTHDSGFYKKLVNEVHKRKAAGTGPELQSALEVWAQVISRPEPDLAIIGLGIRDISNDIELPVVENWFRSEIMDIPKPLTDCILIKIMDQHAFLRIGQGCDLKVGDLVSFGVSHPCTTFDKWKVLLLVDENYQVTSVIKTFF